MVHGAVCFTVPLRAKVLCLSVFQVCFQSVLERRGFGVREVWRATRERWRELERSSSASGEEEGDRTCAKVGV